MRTSRWSWINDGSNNSPPLPMWESVRSGQLVQPDVLTNVKTPFCLRLKGPAEVYADAVVAQ